MNINQCGCRPYEWLGLDGDRCIRVIPRQKEHSISNSFGDIVHDELADVVVSGLEALKDGWELLLDDVSDEELSVPLVLVLSVLELPDGELGKDTED